MKSTETKPLINSGASARWREACSTWELFQQFVEGGWKACGMCGLAAALLLPGTATVQADLHYVDLNGTNASPPYTNWITAATNIQDAVDSAVPGDEIVVTNGTYATGGRSGNHMVVDNPLSVRSVNGPLFTTIDGGHSVRCAYLTNGASLCGFTLANGFASARANQYPETAYGYAVGFLAARSRTAS